MYTPRPIVAATSVSSRGSCDRPATSTSGRSEQAPRRCHEAAAEPLSADVTKTPVAVPTSSAVLVPALSRGSRSSADGRMAPTTLVACRRFAVTSVQVAPASWLSQTASGPSLLMTDVQPVTATRLESAGETASETVRSCEVGPSTYSKVPSASRRYSKMIGAAKRVGSGRATRTPSLAAERCIRLVSFIATSTDWSAFPAVTPPATRQ
mmetsp:Transcript_7269/g.22902  ORF Transcript_7269/g.22902 Transcript_7269/m.22902 type:complete len:209 (-) Transcript_7269:24-650(-)